MDLSPFSWHYYLVIIIKIFKLEVPISNKKLTFLDENFIKFLLKKLGEGEISVLYFNLSATDVQDKVS